MEDCEKYENQLVTQIVTIWCFERNTKQNGGNDEDIINWIGRMGNVDTREWSIMRLSSATSIERFFFFFLPVNKDTYSKG